MMVIGAMGAYRCQRQQGVTAHILEGLGRAPLLPFFCAIFLATAVSGCTEESLSGRAPADLPEAGPLATDAEPVATTPDAAQPAPDLTEAPVSACGAGEGSGSYCDACASDADCGSAAPCCRVDDNGDGFCTGGCNVSAPACMPGAHCMQLGPDDDTFYCKPVTGACWGDGLQCSSCRKQEDCVGGFICYLSELTGEQFCAGQCVRNDDCGRDFRCVETASGNLCMRLVGDEIMPTCLENTSGFCQACTYDFECVSGICFVHSENKLRHCSEACTGPSDKSSCPHGTSCVSSGASPTAFACTPPLNVKCAGWFQCLLVECPSGQVCEDGWCVEEPS